MLSKLILTVSCPLLEAAGCFWLCLGVMLKSCFGILKGGGNLEGGTGNRYHEGDIVAAWVFSSCCCLYRAKTPPTTEWFLPAAMVVNTSACSPSPFCVLQFGTTSGHSVSHPFLWATLSLVGQHSSSSFFSTNFKLLIFDCQMFKMAMLRLSSCHKTGTIRYNQTRALLDTEARQPPVKSGCWGVCCVNFWMRNGRRGALCSLPGAGALLLCNC